jgi:SNF2 family DNA or RNA helicase
MAAPPTGCFSSPLHIPTPPQGKTIQSVSILEHLRSRQHVRGPFLVLAPLSTLGHWKREFEEWTDMNVVYYHDPQGGAEARELIRRCEFYYPGPQGAALAGSKHVYKFNVLITSYHVLLGDWDYLKGIRWQYVIVDEAHGAWTAVAATRLRGPEENGATEASTTLLA